MANEDDTANRLDVALERQQRRGIRHLDRRVLAKAAGASVAQPTCRFNSVRAMSITFARTAPCGSMAYPTHFGMCTTWSFTCFNAKPVGFVTMP